MEREGQSSLKLAAEHGRGLDKACNRSLWEGLMPAPCGASAFTLRNGKRSLPGLFAPRDFHLTVHSQCFNHRARSRWVEAEACPNVSGFLTEDVEPRGSSGTGICFCAFGLVILFSEFFRKGPGPLQFDIMSFPRGKRLIFIFLDVIEKCALRTVSTLCHVKKIQTYVDRFWRIPRVGRELR